MKKASVRYVVTSQREDFELDDYEHVLAAELKPNNTVVVTIVREVVPF